MLPEELLSSLNESIRCRELQIQQTACLLASDFPSPPTLIIHGPEASGKSLTISHLLDAIGTPCAVVPSKECITTRHLLERTLSGVSNALGDNAQSIDGRCESISNFVVQLQRLLEGQKKFILVFDNIDRQREAAPTLLPALARLGEIIPRLTTVFILTFPNARQFHLTGIPHIHFPSYTRAELLSLVSSSPLPLDHRPDQSPIPTASTTNPTISPSDLDYLWSRFTTAVHDSLSQPASNCLPSLRTLCSRLWPPFVAPILAGHYGPREFSKLMVRNRALFQSEDALRETLIPPPIPTANAPDTRSLPAAKRTTNATTFKLPLLPSQLLIAAYLASHTPPKHDTLLFSKFTLSKRRRRGGGTMAPRTPSKKKSQARKISSTMMGAQVFGLERLLAIWAALFAYDDDNEDLGIGGKRKGGKAGGAEVLVQFSTLAGMNLVVRVGAPGVDPLEAGGGKWRCGVGGAFVRKVARGVGFDVDDFLLE